MDANFVGKIIQGRYHIISQLGRGGVGITFLAEDKQCFNSPCVVKQFKPRSANSKTLQVARRLFNREAEILNNLGYCDRIPRLLAYFEEQGDFFLVQELIEGEDLSKEIIPNRPWSEAAAITLVQGILEVLQVVQQHQVIHRDIKPSNLMRRYKDDQIVLIDFGSVKQVSTQVVNSQGEVQPTVAVGTRAYMPMEQMMGRPGFYSDIYAVGVIAIQVLTGLLPKQLSVDSNGELMWRQELNSDFKYNPKFLKIIDKMTRYRFQERYSSAERVLADLQEIKITDRVNTKIVTRTSNQEPEAEFNHNSLEYSLTSQFLPRTTQPQEHLDRPREQWTIVAAIRGRSAKAISMVLSVFFALAIALVIWRFNNSNAIKLAVYENENFRVNYPEDWSKRNRPDFFATGVIFIAKPESESDNFSERVSILVENLPPDKSLATYSAESIAEIKRLSDPRVSKPKKTWLDDQEARTVTFRGKENGVAIRSQQTWSIKNSQAYVITYTAEPDKYNSYLPAVNKIIDSFEIIPSLKK